jgi:hypothetical protein
MESMTEFSFVFSFVMTQMKNDFFDFEIGVPLLGLQPFCDLLKLVIDGHDSYLLKKTRLFEIQMPATGDGESQG